MFIPSASTALERICDKRIEERPCFILFLVLCVLKWPARACQLPERDPRGGRRYRRCGRNRSPRRTPLHVPTLRPRGKPSQSDIYAEIDRAIGDDSRRVSEEPRRPEQTIEADSLVDLPGAESSSKKAKATVNTGEDDDDGNGQRILAPNLWV